MSKEDYTELKSIIAGLGSKMGIGFARVDEKFIDVRNELFGVKQELASIRRTVALWISGVMIAVVVFRYFFKTLGIDA